jgi:type I restriction enzyme S subunit
MAGDTASAALRDLLLTTKDGDWGKELPEKGLVPHRVIRGTDFPGVRIGDTKSVPVRYLSEATVHRRTLMPDDILLETAGGSPGRPTGRSLLITERLLSSLDLPATCASFARFLRVDPSKAVPSFVYWYLQYLYASGQMEEHQVQHTGVARFQYTKFAETEQIPLPDPEEQRAIAHILGTLDDKIELNRRMNETLEAIARALFKSWFVDFDPVLRNMARNGRGQPSPCASRHPLPKVEGLEHRPSNSGGVSVGEGRIEELDALFPDSFVDSELGEIPKGWRVRPVGDFIERLSVGKKYEQKTVRPTGKVPVLDQGKTGVIGYHDNGPGVVASVQHPIAIFANHTCYMRLIHFSFSTIQNVLPFVGKGVDTIWTFYATYGRQSFIEYKGHWPDFVIHKIVMPDPKLTIEFARLVHPLLKLTWARERESGTIAVLRDTLLPKLISGQLRVRDAEWFIAKVGL